MTVAAHSEVDLDPTLTGTSLAQYAAVVAALAEGFALDAVLAVEGVRATDWRRAARAWRTHLVEQAAKKDGSELFQHYEKELATAEDRLGRSVAPLDDDLNAWLAFLHAWAAEAEPAALLEQLGMTMNDVARLRRRWDARMASDERLRKQAEDEAKGARRALPPIRLGEALLRPSPATKGKEIAPEELGVDERARSRVVLLDRASSVAPSAQVPTYLLGQVAGVLTPDRGAPVDAADTTRELPLMAGRRPVVPFGGEPADLASLTRPTAGRAAHDAYAPTMVLPCFTAEPAPSTSPGPAEQAPGQAEVDRTLRGGLHRSAVLPPSRPSDRRRAPEPTAELRLDMLRPALPFVANEARPDAALRPEGPPGKRLARFDSQTGKPLPVPVWVEVPPTRK
jgi:hypothetical protein